MKRAGILAVTAVFALGLAGYAAAEVEDVPEDRGDRIEDRLDRRGDRIGKNGLREFAYRQHPLQLLARRSAFHDDRSEGC